MNTHQFTELLSVAPPFGYEDEFYDPTPADRPALATFPSVNPEHSLGEPETLERSNCDGD